MTRKISANNFVETGLINIYENLYIEIGSKKIIYVKVYSNLHKSIFKFTSTW